MNEKTPESVDFWVANFQQSNSPNQHLLSTAFQHAYVENKGDR
jgi:hypothetical protein